MQLSQHPFVRLGIRFVLSLVGAVATAPAGLSAAPSPQELVVQCEAAVRAAPPSVTLKWVAPAASAAGTGYTINRRRWTELAGWATVATDLPATATTWTDTGVEVGTTYEYQLIRHKVDGKKRNAFGYVAAAINRPLVDSRGTVVLLVDATQSAALATELTVLQSDLAADGWKFIRHDYARAATGFTTSAGYSGHDAEADGAAVRAIKAQIIADAAADPSVNHVLIVGHVPVPHSGNLSHDGHPEQFGACVADTYYGDLNGKWTDTTTELPFTGVNNSNHPGDGRFDQNNIPGAGIQLAVGRVDLFAMPAFAPATETDLLRRYLAKDHAWRTGQWQVQRKVFLSDHLGNLGSGWVPAINGWRSTSVVGIGNVDVLEPKPWVATWFPAISSPAGYLFASGTGWGHYTRSDHIGNTAEFVMYPARAVFLSMWGSGYPQWERQDDLLRAPLCNEGYGLTNLVGGRPNFVLHRMALGASIGDAVRLTQESTAARYEGENDQRLRAPYAALIGDPTLRADPIVPPGAVTAAVAGAKATLRWTASPTPGVIGYHVYRAASAQGPFARISGVEATITSPAGEPVTGTSWTDPKPLLETSVYLIKAVKLETTPGGTYYNTSLGAPVTVGSDQDAQPRVLVSNGAGSIASDAAILSVQVPVALAVQPRERIVTVGEEAVFTAAATGSPWPTFQWQRNGKNIPGATMNIQAGPEEPYRIPNSLPGGYWNDSPGWTSYATTKTTLSDDGALFTVVATNGSGTVTSQAVRLFVNPSANVLSFTTQPSNVTVGLGQVATFSASALGKSAPTYQWKRNDVDIPGATAATYTTSPAAVGDHGAVYRVVATNADGKATSAPAMLGIQSRSPIFQADFDGLGLGMGGADDMVSFGGHAARINGLSPLNTIGKDAPLASGSGGYLNSTFVHTGNQPIATFVPETAANSFAAFYGGVVSNAGKSWVILNGGFDIFVRLKVQDPSDTGAGRGRSSAWFNPFDANGIVKIATPQKKLDSRFNPTGGAEVKASKTPVESLPQVSKGLRLLFIGRHGGASLELITGSPNAIVDYARTFGNSGSGDMPSGQQVHMETPAGLLAEEGAVHHLALTLHTDANGLITAKVFAAPGTEAIDTRAEAGLQYKATFKLDADLIGANPLGAGGWTMNEYAGKEGAGTSVDYDTLRLYNAEPEMFPALVGRIGRK